MNIIESSVSEIRESDPQKQIELVARTCYKSEDKITDVSNKVICRSLYNNKHWAMLEHYVFVYELNNECEFKIPVFDYFDSQRFVNTTLHKVDDSYRSVISFSARSLLDMLEDCARRDTWEAKYQAEVVENLIEKVIYDYNCEDIFGNHFPRTNHDKYVKVDVSTLSAEEQFIHEWHTFKFVTDRGVSHELVRHRTASFAQESTRYCNYSQDKFGKELTFIKPANFDTFSNTAQTLFQSNCLNVEWMYLRMLEEGLTPQQARAVLPNSIKTEIVVTANAKEWNHIGNLRLRGVTGSPHPDMIELMTKLKEIYLEL